jgi:hypothetical protein
MLVEEVLLCWNFSLLLIFQPRHVSFLYFCVLMLTLMVDNHRWYNTTTPFFDSSLADSQTDFCGESSATLMFYVCSYFLAQVWLFCLLQCFSAETDMGKFHSIWNYYIPSCIPHWQIHKHISTERALSREQRLSLVDDWRHCCRCSWLKRRGAASMGRGQTVFPQKTV